MALAESLALTLIYRVDDILKIFFSLQQYTRCENEKSLTLKESVNPDEDEEIPILSKEQKSTSLFSNISLSLSHPSDEGRKSDAFYA